MAKFGFFPNVNASYQGDQIVMLPEKASQGFTAGSPLSFSSGYVQESGQDPTSIVGVALSDGHNSGSDGQYLVPVATPEQFFIGRVYHSNSTYNKIEATDLGQAYGIAKVSNVGWVIDKTDTSNVRVRIIANLDPIGTVNGRVLFKFIPDYVFPKA